MYQDCQRKKTLLREKCLFVFFQLKLSNRVKQGLGKQLSFPLKTTITTNKQKLTKYANKGWSVFFSQFFKN